MPKNSLLRTSESQIQSYVSRRNQLFMNRVTKKFMEKRARGPDVSAGKKMNEAIDAIESLANYGGHIAGQDPIISETLALANIAAAANINSSADNLSKLSLIGGFNHRGSVGSVLSVDRGNPLLPV